VQGLNQEFEGEIEEGNQEEKRQRELDHLQILAEASLS